jgi:hypothetical protein
MAILRGIQQIFGTGRGGKGFENIPVTSTCFARLEYNDDDKTAALTFQKGGRYLLQGIDRIEVERMASSDSPGGYWNSNVKGQY